MEQFAGFSIWARRIFGVSMALVLLLVFAATEGGGEFEGGAGELTGIGNEGNLGRRMEMVREGVSRERMVAAIVLWMDRSGVHIQVNIESFVRLHSSVERIQN